MSDFEILRDKQFLAELEESNGWPGQAKPLRAEIDREKRRLDFFMATKRALLELCGPAWQEANVIFGSDEVEYSKNGQTVRFYTGLASMDFEQRLPTFAQVLVTVGLIQQADVDALRAAGRFVFTDPVLTAERQAAAKERGELQRAFEQILAACSDRQRALDFYNGLGGERSEDKLDSWVSELCAAKLLGLAWMPGRRVGSLLDHLKSLSPVRANKSMDPRSANK